MYIYLDSAKFKILWKKVRTFLNDAFQSYYDIHKISDIYINHNNCLEHMLIIYLAESCEKLRSKADVFPHKKTYEVSFHQYASF